MDVANSLYSTKLQLPDYSACTTTGNISNFDGRVGGLLFQNDGGIVHLGICVGRGNVIHASGSSIGVIKQSITSRFNKYYIPNFVNYTFTQPSSSIILIHLF